MTLSDYTTLVQNECDDVSTRAKNIIERAIKDTYQEILRFTVELLVGTTEEDVTATAEQRYVTPANTYQDIKSVLWKKTGGNNYYNLKQTTEEEYYKRYVNSDSNNPTAFYLNGGNIYFDIAPDNAGTVKISGVEVQDELTGSEVSVIPDRFTSLVVQGSIARFKAYEGVPEAREYFKLYRGPYFEQGKLGGQLKGMVDELATRQPIKKIKLFGN